MSSLLLQEPHLQPLQRTPIPEEGLEAQDNVPDERGIGVRTNMRTLPPSTESSAPLGSTSKHAHIHCQVLGKARPEAWGSLLLLDPRPPRPASPLY